MVLPKLAIILSMKNGWAAVPQGCSRPLALPCFMPTHEEVRAEEIVGRLLLNTFDSLTHIANVYWPSPH